MEKKYYRVNQVYLANALSFLGFRYYKFNEGGEVLYTFEDTKRFREALTTLMGLKNKYSSYYNS